jgi:hypothetical protein
MPSEMGFYFLAFFSIFWIMIGIMGLIMTLIEISPGVKKFFAKHSNILIHH